MPERCVPMNKCGTQAPLWLVRRHPKRREGIVTRNICGNWKKKCCAFRSTSIKVKKCRGNYYVYKFAPPSTCYLAYCAGGKCAFFNPLQLIGQMWNVLFSLDGSKMHLNMDKWAHSAKATDPQSVDLAFYSPIVL